MKNLIVPQSDTNRYLVYRAPNILQGYQLEYTELQDITQAIKNTKNTLRTEKNYYHLYLLSHVDTGEISSYWSGVEIYLSDTAHETLTTTEAQDLSELLSEIIWEVVADTYEAINMLWYEDPETEYGLGDTYEDRYRAATIRNDCYLHLEYNQDQIQEHQTETELSELQIAYIQVVRNQATPWQTLLVETDKHQQL